MFLPPRANAKFAAPPSAKYYITVKPRVVNPEGGGGHNIGVGKGGLRGLEPLPIGYQSEKFKLIFI
jgi:hypothetical protein